jgi:putative endonuclease
MSAGPASPFDETRRGRAGEDLAAAFLTLVGYDVVERNVRVAGGEIDLVARREGWLILCEVRLRTEHGFGHPAETVQGRKLHALVRAGRAYVARRPRETTCWRFDLLTVRFTSPTEAQVQHFPGAVPLDGGRPRGG